MNVVYPVSWFFAGLATAFMIWSLGRLYLHRQEQSRAAFKSEIRADVRKQVTDYMDTYKDTLSKIHGDKS